MHPQIPHGGMVVAQDTSDVAVSPLPGSAEAFGELVDPYRHELLVHCYRMLGSIDDAEDAVQDALVRAWHGRDTFQRAISFRAWLYRIATNACLDAMERRKRGRGREDSLGVGPYPDDILGVASAGPEARYDSHESISLAFLTALQLLPPRQRAVLILRDVLSWHAAEVAELLELTVPAVNSALFRARTTVSRQYRPESAAANDGLGQAPGHLRTLLDRYVRAWEAADVAGLVALLRDDAVLSMPPGLSFEGAPAIGVFLAQVVFADGQVQRLVPVQANGGLGFVVYSGAKVGARLRATTLVVLDLTGSRIARMTAYVDPRDIARFGVAQALAG
jgi:RNA polymerase sigma-70 factor (ECF subfamily)